MNGRALVAWNLRKLRVARGLSQEKLAADTGIDRAYLGGVEREAENPSVDLLERLAEGLDVPIVDFFQIPRRSERPPEPLRPGRKPLG